MASYRDDTQETAVASNTIISMITGLAQEAAKIADAVLFGLLVMHSASALAADEVLDKRVVLTEESAQIADQVIDQAALSNFFGDSLLVTEQLFQRVGSVTTESATAADEVSDNLLSMVRESAAISDTIIGQRSAVSTVLDAARISDRAFQAANTLVVESALAGDIPTGKLRAAVLITDAFQIEDFTTGALQLGAMLIKEVAHASDLTTGLLTAINLIKDGAIISDEVIHGDGVFGQAWTANSVNWAMSRYSPYGFTSLAVIGGVLYGSNLDGVFALSGGDEDITASLRTGKLDLGRGALVHPLYAFMEYELDGTSEMDVTQTQSGNAQTYTYILPPEASQELTSGRFTFGRGLRGRHFSLEVRIVGKHATINDLSVETAPTKRRI